MDLIGVVHNYRYLDDVDNYILSTHPKGIQSLMVELPPNWPEFKARNARYTNFFDILAHRYEKRGTRIVYGDRGRESHLSRLESISSLPFSSLLLILYGLPERFYSYLDASFTHLRD